MAVRHGFLQKEFHFLDLLCSMSAQYRETYKATSSWHSIWTMIVFLAMEFKFRFLALVWHGSLQWYSVHEYMEDMTRLKNNARYTIDMPIFMFPKSIRNGPGTTTPLPAMQKEGAKNTQECFIFFPYSKATVLGFGSWELELIFD